MVLGIVRGPDVANVGVSYGEAVFEGDNLAIVNTSLQSHT